MEYFKWMGESARKEVLKIINKMWNENWFLENMEEANVVTLYKKGNAEDPANYRPISLLQSLYKIYAGIIKNRLADSIDERIWKLQFGFRGKKEHGSGNVHLQKITRHSGKVRRENDNDFPRLGKSV